MIRKKYNIYLAPVAFAMLALSFATPSYAGTTIKASLWDKGGTMEMPTNAGMGSKNMSKATMGIKLSTVSVPAGEVTFQASNDSKDTEHEMIVAPVPAGGKPLPFNAAEDRVDEEAAGALGEVEELDPGKSGTVTLNLKPGKYVLFCNIAGHYKAGMWTLLTVR